MFKLEDLYEELAKKHNLTINQVERICRAQFRWIMESIQSNEFKTINVIKLGKFVPNFNSIKYRKLEFYEGYPKRSNIPYPEKWEKDKAENSSNKEDVRDIRDNARTVSQSEGDSNKAILSDKK